MRRPSSDQLATTNPSKLPTRAASEDAADEVKALEPNHTHFILVDDPDWKRDEHEHFTWGGEIRIANMVSAQKRPEAPVGSSAG